jgi:RNA polymerase sigma-70 factor (ECF subfamily)
MASWFTNEQFARMLALMSESPRDQHQRNESFATTQWSVVLAAGRQLHGDGPRIALAALCQTYWLPVYEFIRRRSPSADDARDLTQDFFCQLLERDALAVATPERGRFRAFLQTSVKNFLSNERERGRAQKRGGGRPALSLDWAAAESRMHWEPAVTITPERQFERAWATTLLERVVEQLRDEMAAAGNGRQFDVLKPALLGPKEQVSYQEPAVSLGCSPETARQKAHRMRKRYRELLREEVAQTVADPLEIDDEIRYLFEVFS